MGIGLRKQVQLIKLVVTQDSTGRNQTTEGDKFGVWAEVSSPSGFRNYENGQTQLGHTKRFLVRFKFQKYPNADWKVRYENMDWTVTEIQKRDEKRFYWQITATAKSDK